MTDPDPYRYFAIVDDRHDAKDPLTLVRVDEQAGPAGVRELSRDVRWVRTTLLDRIDAGEVPYRAVSIGDRAAGHIRERWEKKISYRYSLLVRDADPTDAPVGVLREWNATDRDWVYAETYSRRAGGWGSSNVRQDIERGSNISLRIVASDAATVHRYISSVNGW
jgi:hypothetical protein